MIQIPSPHIAKEVNKTHASTDITSNNNKVCYKKIPVSDGQNKMYKFSLCNVNDYNDVKLLDLKDSNINGKVQAPTGNSDGYDKTFDGINNGNTSNTTNAAVVQEILGENPTLNIYDSKPLTNFVNNSTIEICINVNKYLMNDNDVNIHLDNVSKIESNIVNISSKKCVLGLQGSEKELETGNNFNS